MNDNETVTWLGAANREHWILRLNVHPDDDTPNAADGPRTICHRPTPYVLVAWHTAIADDNARRLFELTEGQTRQ